MIRVSSNLKSGFYYAYKGFNLVIRGKASKSNPLQYFKGILERDLIDLKSFFLSRFYY
jgi:hypothetical protein